MLRWCGVAAQPDPLDPERGGRPDDRADVERLADRVEQQPDPGLGQLAPGPVQALDVRGAQRPGYSGPGPGGHPPTPLARPPPATLSTRYPARAAMRSAGQPEYPSHRCTRLEPSKRWTQRDAAPARPRPATHFHRSTLRSALP